MEININDIKTSINSKEAAFNIIKEEFNKKIRKRNY